MPALRAGWCAFHGDSNPRKYAFLTDRARRLVDRLSLLIHTVLPDSSHPPADHMCQVIVRPEGSLNDKFLVRDVLCEKSLPSCHIFNDHLIPFVFTQRTNGGPLQ